MSDKNAHITGLGLALPAHWVTQADSARHALSTSQATNGQRNFAERVYQNAGIASRHSVLLEASSAEGQPVQQSYYLPQDDANPTGPSTAQRMHSYREHAAPLACRAAEKALAESGVDRSDITHLVTVSCSGFYSPGYDIQMIQQLDLNPQTTRTHVGFMGCHGALNGLRVAKAIAEADPDARVLMACVELCSLHYHYDWTPQRIVSNSLFADGAASVVVRAGGEAEDVALRNNWSEVVPGTLDAMTWSIGDHGFEMTLSPTVPELIHKRLPSVLSSWLAEHGMTIQDIDAWAVHPGGPKILEAVEEALELKAGALRASRDVLSRYGNMSSPTLLFVLNELQQQRRTGPTVMLGFGPGLTIECALVG